MHDPWAEQFGRILETVRHGPGMLESGMRQAAISRGVLPQPLATYVDKVADHPHNVSDEDVHGLLEVGYSEDQIFEATVSAALGAGLLRLKAGLDAMRGRVDEA